MYEIFDSFCWTKENKTITKEKHHVKGLGNFTYWNYTSSPAPSPMHYHSDILEIHCMLKGQRFSQIEKDGTIHNYTYHGNEAFLTFPFEIHGSGDEPPLPCEFYACQIITQNPDELLGLDKEYSNALYNSLMALQTHQLQLGMTHIQYLRTAFNFFSDFTPNSTRIGVSFLLSFLFSLQLLSPIRETDTKQINRHIQYAISFLNQHIDEPLQIRDLAEVSGYSLSRFKVCFREEVGITPMEYINLQKISYAKKILSKGESNITNLAFMLGFSSSNYFSSVFKKYTNCTPREYQKKHH